MPISMVVGTKESPLTALTFFPSFLLHTAIVRARAFFFCLFVVFLNFETHGVLPLF
jgi:hypothetical protein